MLKDKQLRAIGPPLKRDHRSVFHWIEWKKPIAKGEDDWILHKDDLVTLANIDHFESSLITPWSRVSFPRRSGLRYGELTSVNNPASLWFFKTWCQ
jgi:hypothetical protein